jgi:cell division protein FtsB
MKRAIPFVLIVAALVAALYSLLGSGGYPRLEQLESLLGRQRDKNAEMKAYINSLRQEIYALQKDDRYLEKVARDELGMARPNEEIFIFNDDKPASGEATVSTGSQGVTHAE